MCVLIKSEWEHTHSWNGLSVTFFIPRELPTEEMPPTNPRHPHCVSVRVNAWEFQMHAKHTLADSLTHTRTHALPNARMHARIHTYPRNPCYLYRHFSRLSGSFCTYFQSSTPSIAQGALPWTEPFTGYHSHTYFCRSPVNPIFGGGGGGGGGGAGGGGGQG